MTIDRRTAGGVVIPPSVSSLRTLSLTCLICGGQFYSDEMSAYTRHVAKCARENEEAIHLASPRTRLRAFEDPAHWDVEYERWVGENPRKWYREHGIEPKRDDPL